MDESNLNIAIVLKGESYKMSADIWSLGAVVSFLARRGVHLFNNDFSVHNWPRGKHSMKKVQVKIAITFTQSFTISNPTGAFSPPYLTSGLIVIIDMLSEGHGFRVCCICLLTSLV